MVCAPPQGGERPSGDDSAVTQSRRVTIRDQPLRIYSSQGGHDYCTKSRRNPFQTLSSMVSTELLANRQVRNHFKLGNRFKFVGTDL